MSCKSSKRVKRRHLAFLQRKSLIPQSCHFGHRCFFYLFLVISNRGHGHSTQDRLWTSPPSLVGPRWRYPARRVWKPGRGSILKGRTTSLNVFFLIYERIVIFFQPERVNFFFGPSSSALLGWNLMFFLFFSTLTMGIYLRSYRRHCIPAWMFFFSILRSVQHTFQVREKMR